MQWAKVTASEGGGSADEVSAMNGALKCSNEGGCCRDPGACEGKASIAGTSLTAGKGRGNHGLVQDPLEVVLLLLMM